MQHARAALILTAVLILSAHTAMAGKASPASREDEAAIRDVTRRYCDAWLKGDADAVMATLTQDAVLLPSGQGPVSGTEAIRAFWWPPKTPPTKVTAMDLQIAAIHLEGNLAVVHGKGTVSFSYTQDGVEKSGGATSTFLNIYTQSPDGNWRMSHRMWSNLPTK